jgi:hypothetical protein
VRTHRFLNPPGFFFGGSALGTVRAGGGNVTGVTAAGISTLGLPITESEVELGSLGGKARSLGFLKVKNKFEGEVEYI